MVKRIIKTIKNRKYLVNIPIVDSFVDFVILLTEDGDIKTDENGNIRILE